MSLKMKKCEPINNFRVVMARLSKGVRKRARGPPDERALDLRNEEKKMRLRQDVIIINRFRRTFFKS